MTGGLGPVPMNGSLELSNLSILFFDHICQNLHLYFGITHILIVFLIALLKDVKHKFLKHSTSSPRSLLLPVLNLSALLFSDATRNLHGSNSIVICLLPKNGRSLELILLAGNVQRTLGLQKELCTFLHIRKF